MAARILSILLRATILKKVYSDPRYSTLSTRPCLVRTNLKNPLHLGDGYPHLVHRHVIDKPVPLEKRHACLVENRPRCHAGLMAASLTVEKPSSLKKPELIMTTNRTLESQRPPLLNQMLGARLVCRELLLEVQQAPLFVRIRHGSIARFCSPQSIPN